MFPLSHKTRYLLPILAFWALIFGLQNMNRHHSGGVALILAVTVAFIAYLLSPPRLTIAIPKIGNRAWYAGLALICIVHLGYVASHLRHPAIVDIGGTTLTAGQLMVAGDDPYQSNCDREAVNLLKSSGVVADPERYHGYKYLPMMAVAYMPLGLPFGARGLIISNLVFMGLLVGALYNLVRIISGRQAARWAVLLIGTMPLPIFQLYAKGVTDVVPVLPLIFALPLINRRPGLAGLLMGLSISVKLIPALLVLPLFLPEEKAMRRQFIFGALVGLVPTAVYVLWAPHAFMDNIVFFNGIRPIDQTSWMFGRSHPLVSAVHLAFAACWLATVAITVLAMPSIRFRCGLIAIVLATTILSGPGMHENYILWIIPFVAVMLSTRAAPRVDAVVPVILQAA